MKFIDKKCPKCGNEATIKWDGEIICLNKNCDFDDDNLVECSCCGRETYPAKFDSNGRCLDCQDYFAAYDY